MRWLFFATALFVWLQTAEKDVYPGLHAPGFGHPGRLADLARQPEARVVDVRVHFRGGGEQEFRLLDLLPRTHYKQRQVVERALVGALTSERSAEVRDWLRREVAARAPGQVAERIEVIARPRMGSGAPEILYADEPGSAA